MLKDKLLYLILCIVITSSIVFGAVEGDNFVSIQENLSEIDQSNYSEEELIEFSEENIMIGNESYNLNDGETDCIYYFYGTGCENCNVTDKFFNQLKKKYINLNIEKYEVYHNEDNLVLLNKFYNNYDIPIADQKIPAVMIAKTYFIGQESITNFLEQRIRDNIAGPCPDPNNTDVMGLAGKGSPKNIVETLSIGNAGASALVNFFKNTNSSILLLFLILILILIYEKGESIKEKKEHLLRGSVVFVLSSLFLLILGGIGLFSSVSFGDSKVFSTILAIVTVIVSLMIMKRFLFEGHVIPRKMLEKVVPIYDKFIHYLITPIGFLISAVIATLYSVASWDGTYQIIQGLNSNQTLGGKSFTLLMMHSLVFIIPIVIAFGVVYWRLELISKIEEPKLIEHKLKLLRFFIALFVFLVGLVNLFLFP